MTADTARHPDDVMWFAVLPDTESGGAAARLLRRGGAREEVPHASGRPWLLGRWEPGEMTVAGAGTVRVAATGPGAAVLTRLSAPLARLRTTCDLDRISARLPGAHHLLCSADGQVRAQGTLAHTCRVFYCRLAGCMVAADRSDVLAAACGAPIDEGVLALRLLSPSAPFPLADRPLWQGVNAVPGDHCLLLDAHGGARTVRRWRPPPAELPLDQAASAVRDALVAAVAARTHDGGTISADLSGGMDSTSLCFLADRGPARLLTYRHGSADPAHDDAVWARIAVDALPGAKHLNAEIDGIPAVFAGLTAPDADPEEPFRWVRSQARLADLGQRMAAAGARLHMTGDGGDELFGSTPSALHSLARVRPLTALRQLRDHRALRRWPLAASLKTLADTSAYPSWLAARCGPLLDALPPPTVPSVWWGPPLRLPRWATPQAAALVRERLTHTAGEQPEPLAPLRVQHERLHYAQVCGRTIRLADRITAPYGVRLAAPYLDDHVIEAALSARLELHAPPDRYKPVLAHAMRKIVPDSLLHRTTKGAFGADTYTGLDRHRAELLALHSEDSLLARRRLVDAGALRAALVAPHRDTSTIWPLDPTLAAERWLRAATAKGPR
ncbi:asparagine synthase-related protein [Streptomyces sp. NPDC057908]|uniref:asparagine synthase-related protein n=1 Tax=Streptomyces sp. NPDC057908 TaxID=3346276 RepID=UPI0036EB57BF